VRSWVRTSLLARIEGQEHIGHGAANRLLHRSWRLDRVGHFLRARSTRKGGRRRRTSSASRDFLWRLFTRQPGRLRLERSSSDFRRPGRSLRRQFTVNSSGSIPSCRLSTVDCRLCASPTNNWRIVLYKDLICFLRSWVRKRSKLLVAECPSNRRAMA
jgi:hypothetical protein